MKLQNILLKILLTNVIVLFGPAALVLSLLAPAAAQSISSTGPTVIVPGAPFQGERVGRLVQKLANGVTITHEVRGQMARDSDGRVRKEEQQTNKPMFVTVIDPAQHIELRWSSSSKSATKLPFLGQEHVTFPLQPWLAILKGRGWDQPGTGEPDQISTEDLGKKTINGLLATGTRTITVVPTGELGNDRPVRIVHEVWFSEDLKLALLDTLDDPIGGLQTLEIQGITRAEPDGALFRLPEGYQLRGLLDGGLAAGISSSPAGAPGQGGISPPPAPAAVPGRIRVGGEVQAARIISQPQPVYPPVALQARITGNVVLHAIIGKDGAVSELQVVSGHPLLVQAAMDAAKKWRYTPTLLDGKAVEVDTTVSVPFFLDDK